MSNLNSDCLAICFTLNHVKYYRTGLTEILQITGCHTQSIVGQLLLRYFPPFQYGGRLFGL